MEGENKELKPAPKPEPKPLKYIGPFYRKGLIIGGDTYRPLEMNEQEIQNLIAKFPKTAQFFKR